jgi:hypothetical protein
MNILILRLNGLFGRHTAIWVIALMMSTATLSVFVTSCNRSKTGSVLDTRTEPTDTFSFLGWFTHEEYRVVTPEDRLSCAFEQTEDISASTGYGLSGHMSVNKIHNYLSCKDNGGVGTSIQLKSVELRDGKAAIITENFGTILKGNRPGSFDKYEMTERQIKRLKSYLGF